MIEAPRWLEEENDIAQLLHRFLDKLDKKPADQLLAKKNEAADQQWAFIRQLEALGVFQVLLSRQRGLYDPEYIDARLLFERDAEPSVRTWLKRPKAVSALESWRQEVERHTQLLPGNRNVLNVKAKLLPTLREVGRFVGQELLL